MKNAKQPISIKRFTDGLSRDFVDVPTNRLALSSATHPNRTTSLGTDGPENESALAVERCARGGAAGPNTSAVRRLNP
jgi:hypothetical protein